MGMWDMWHSAQQAQLCPAPLYQIFPSLSRLEGWIGTRQVSQTRE